MDVDPLASDHAVESHPKDCSALPYEISHGSS
jgi:hypothetical protein